MIEVKNLTKKFQHKGVDVVAVDNVSFTVNQGEAVAFIGPNGAGKSTTIKMLTGILWPTTGKVEVLGFSPQHDRKKVVSQIGAVFGQRSSLLLNLPPGDTLALYGVMYGLSKKEITERTESLVRMLNIESFVTQPIRTLSLGQRMRVEIACALVHNPKILFLDEPSIGLDIIAKQTLRELLSDLRSKHNITIFLTSHDVGDIEAVCDRTILINHGRVVIDEPTSQLRQRIQNERQIALHTKDFPHLDIAQVVRTQDEGRTLFTVDTSRVEVATVLKKILETGYTGEIEVLSPSLEDVLVKLYQE